ncbi:hypothetical protein EIP91_008475 [Steccherinum ochraceum]|uniref:Protein BIG1 n=1 Tax=Steccherinum ochraceum TaxID=92696 RepID=A0A4R0RU18_9APHY|nr:hypothetical protein EIP91_008475 [Steccherinum ochraceum]
MVAFQHGLIVTSLIHAALASRQASPLVAWSSLSTELLPTSSSSTPADDFFDLWIHNDDACEFDAVILVNQPGLHASDLRTLSSSSPLPKILESAPSSAQIPYTQLSAEQSRGSAANDISRRCGSRAISLAEAKQLHQQDISGSKFIVSVEVPGLDMSSSRKSQMEVIGQQLAQELEGLASAFPDHLVVYSDWEQSSHVPVASLLSRQDTSAPKKSTATGILKRYQLLSPALILSLFLTLFILLPLLMISIQALTSIQSPVRLDGKMLAEYREKKNQ